MNKHTVITCIAIVVMAVPFAYSGMNIYAAEQLQYRWGDAEGFSFFAMSNSGYVEFCNPTPLWADLRSFQADLFYDADILGTFVVDGVGLEPSSSALQYGGFRSDEFITVQSIFMTLDYEFDGGDVRLDPTKMYVLVTVSTPVLGFIPYATSSQYTGFGFDGMMRGDGFRC